MAARAWTARAPFPDHLVDGDRLRQPLSSRGSEIDEAGRGTRPHHGSSRPVARIWPPPARATSRAASTTVVPWTSPASKVTSPRASPTRISSGGASSRRWRRHAAAWSPRRTERSPPMRRRPSCRPPSSSPRRHGPPRRLGENGEVIPADLVVGKIAESGQEFGRAHEIGEEDTGCPAGRRRPHEASVSPRDEGGSWGDYVPP
jgi:hypothetical protein